ncbi:MAG: XRE family transcriptional regulator [Chitinophagaceae bacterium]|nr:MAG: XRE family transcriptional regulator [Chitinophagaceae bacterium]
MKLSKQLRVLSGPTAIRIKMGLTQLALAKYLGISKSLVSMIENGNRSLPLAALLKISELEIHFAQLSASGNDAALSLPEYQESATEKTIRTSREKANELRLSQKKYELKWMAIKQQEIIQQIQQLDIAIAFESQYGAPGDDSPLVISRKGLLKKLKHCDQQAIAKLEGKIAQLEVVIASYAVNSPHEIPAENSINAAAPELSVPAVPAFQKQILPYGEPLFVNATYPTFSWILARQANSRHYSLAGPPVNTLRTPIPSSQLRA